jgi:hypothetical protein
MCVSYFCLNKNSLSYKCSIIKDDGSCIDYYLGEAILAFMKLYNKIGNKTFLDSSYKAFSYYKEYWRKNKNTAFILLPGQVYFYYIMK